MAITSSYPKPPLLHTKITSKNSKKWIPITTHSISNTPLQFQLPLHKPHYKIHQPIKPKIKKTTDPSCTISDVLRLMDSLGFNIPVDIYVSLIKECTESRDPLNAVEVYEHICKSDVIPSLPLLNRLLLMLVFCGCFDQARQLFDKMRVRNSQSWAAMIAGCVENGECEGALRLFMEMQSEAGNLCKCGDLIDDGILVCVLKACVELMNLEFGRQIHGWLLKLGNCESMVLNSFLIKFYGEFGYLESADNVFDHVPHCNTVVWTARIGNLCKEEQFEGAITIFREMVREGVKKNSFTFSSILKACGKLRDAGCCGQQVHATSVKVGLDTDSYVLCSLIDMYGKYGLLKDARRVFNAREDKSNIACWNAMLMGCIQHGFGVEAMKVLYEMKEAGLQPHKSLINEVFLAPTGTELAGASSSSSVMIAHSTPLYWLISSFLDEFVAFEVSTRLDELFAYQGSTRCIDLHRSGRTRAYGTTGLGNAGYMENPNNERDQILANPRLSTDILVLAVALIN